MRFIATMILCLSCSPILANTEHCLAVALHKEASIESDKGKRLVLDTILNRSRLKGKSACSVIKERGQFSWNTRRLVADKNQLTELKRVRRIRTVSSDVTHFHHKRVKPVWAKKMNIVAKTKHHIFYKQRKAK